MMRQLKVPKQITKRDAKSLDKYLQEIGKEKMVTEEEEVNLAQRIKEGDEEALKKLAKANLCFVVSVAKQYQGQGLTLSDLINEGNVGLIKAGQRFDETRGFKFISYAVWWIRQSILQGIAEHGRIVRLPLNKIGNLNKANKAISRLEQKFERNPTYQEIADELDVSKYVIERAMENWHKNAILLDAPINEKETITLGDLLENHDHNLDTTITQNQKSLEEEIEMALDKISKKKKKNGHYYKLIVISLLGLNGQRIKTREELADELGFSSPERVRQLFNEAMEALRKDKKIAETLRSYL